MLHQSLINLVTKTSISQTNKYLDKTKTADLDPDRNYLSGCHPHGVFAFSTFATHGTNALGWDDIFPGINHQYITLEVS